MGNSFPIMRCFMYDIQTPNLFPNLFVLVFFFHLVVSILSEAFFVDIKHEHKRNIVVHF